MAHYGYDKIGVLAESLEKHGIPQDIAGKILAGGEAVKKTDPAESRIAWLRAAMRRMDELLDVETRRAVRQSCACCLGGKRLQLSKSIAKNHATLEARIAAANETKMVFGHAVRMQEDGNILVQFWEEGHPPYRCSCLPAAKEPLSITYCYCCAGHVKHHLQIALGRTLEVKMKSSALSSGGQRPCQFLFKLLEN